MFRGKFQKGTLSILYSCGAAPLEFWDIHVKNGCIRRVTDADVNSLALEIAGSNVSTTYIYSPKDPATVLGISLPFVIMIVKNLKKYFTFEITIIDDQRMHRRFRASNFQSITRVKPFSTSMPIGLSDGWNQIQFNLAEFTRRAYGTNYMETTKMQIHANCRIRRIYFADRLYEENELPEDYKMSILLQKCGNKSKTSLKGPSKISMGALSKSSTEREDYNNDKIENESIMYALIDDEEEPRNLVTPEENVKPKLDVHIPLAFENQEEEEEEGEEEDDENTEREFDNKSKITEAESDKNEDDIEDEDEEEIPEIVNDELKIEEMQDDGGDESIKKEPSETKEDQIQASYEGDNEEDNEENLTIDV